MRPPVPWLPATHISSQVSSVARDRAWFTEYTPFKTFATTLYGDGQLQALGVGVVHLPVKLSPKRSGPRSHGTLKLCNVLHIPSSICNIVGNGSTGDYASVTFGGLDDGSKGAMYDRDGRRVAYFVDKPNSGLCMLRLSGPPVGPSVGPSSFDKGKRYLINACWPKSERQRWATFQQVMAKKASEPPYTTAEKEWLKRDFGGEFHFLQIYGLKMHNEDDREEGRAIARAMMTNDHESEI